MTTSPSVKVPPRVGNGMMREEAKRTRLCSLGLLVPLRGPSIERDAPRRRPVAKEFGVAGQQALRPGTQVAAFAPIHLGQFRPINLVNNGLLVVTLGDHANFSFCQGASSGWKRPDARGGQAHQALLP